MAQWNGNRPLIVLTFELEGEVFALEATHVREILDPGPVTEVPNSAPHVGGLINVRGKVVPLADIRLKFGMSQRPATIDTRFVVIEAMVDGDPVIVAILADKVHEIAEMAAASLEETPRIGMRWRPDYITCVGKRGPDFIIVLDIGRILSADSQPRLTAA
ncbi:chemotaxis protein CheW [Niveispirillum sp. KHB5.9]|uniref:chemotaxis protein CheW n=1 Tax=Niveispirillum sp. KHB5.9 TaxID=3400269 RepID=UPI003A857C06